MRVRVDGSRTWIQVLELALLEQPVTLSRRGRAHHPSGDGRLAGPGAAGDDADTRLIGADPLHDGVDLFAPTGEPGTVAVTATCGEQQVLDDLGPGCLLVLRVGDDRTRQALAPEHGSLTLPLTPLGEQRVPQIVALEPAVVHRPCASQRRIGRAVANHVDEMTPEDAVPRGLEGLARGEHPDPDLRGILRLLQDLGGDLGVQLAGRTREAGVDDDEDLAEVAVQALEDDLLGRDAGSWLILAVTRHQP